MIPDKPFVLLRDEKEAKHEDNSLKSGSRCARKYIWKTHAHLHILAMLPFAFQAAGGKICFSSNKERGGGDRTPAGIVRLVGYTKGVAARKSG